MVRAGSVSIGRGRLPRPRPALHCVAFGGGGEGSDDRYRSRQLDEAAGQARQRRGPGRRGPSPPPPRDGSNDGAERSLERYFLSTRFVGGARNETLSDTGASFFASGISPRIWSSRDLCDSTRAPTCWMKPDFARFSSSISEISCMRLLWALAMIFSACSSASDMRISASLRVFAFMSSDRRWAVVSVCWSRCSRSL